MITLRQSGQRHHDRTRRREVWLTFDAEDRSDPLHDGFGVLETISEDRLSPGASVPQRPRHDAEIITYVREGTVAYEDSSGRSGIIHAGEFERLSAGRGLRHGEANALRTEWAHVFQIWLRPSEAELASDREQKRFSAAERRGGLRIIASPDARRGSLRINQDALMYSAMLEPGQHVVHEIRPRRTAWLHIVEGGVTLGDIVLNSGDSAGFTSERSVSMTARKDSELLLFDVGEHQASLTR